MDTIRLKARAKINLGLDVVRRREDGYHEVRMVMQMLKLYDQIDIEKTETPGIRLTCEIYPFLPTDERNIAYKAAKVMMEQFDIKQGVCIRIEKHIPVAAGMAGGSSNAAAVLLRNEPDVPVGTFSKRADGKRREAWGGCSLLHYARNGTRRRNRGKN